MVAWKMGSMRKASVLTYLAIGLIASFSQFNSITAQLTTPTATDPTPTATDPTNPTPTGTIPPTTTGTTPPPGQPPPPPTPPPPGGQPPPPTQPCKTDADCTSEESCQKFYGDPTLFLVQWTIPDPNGVGPPTYLNQSAELPPPPDADQQTMECFVKDQNVIDNLQTVCICVHEFPVLASSRKNNKKVTQPKNKKSIKPKSGRRQKRQVPCTPPLAINRCEGWYIHTLLPDLYRDIITTSETVQEGDVCDPGYEDHLTEAMYELGRNQYLYRATAFFRLVNSIPNLVFCNRRRLQSCNKVQETCGCVSDYLEMPLYQLKATGHRTYSDNGIVSYYCYVIQDSCSFSPTEVLPQFKEVQDKLANHYGDLNDPTNLDSNGCLKNYCAQIDPMNVDKCQPHDPQSSTMSLGSSRKTAIKKIPNQQLAHYNYNHKESFKSHHNPEHQAHSVKAPRKKSMTKEEFFHHKFI